MSNFLSDVSSTKITLAHPVLCQPDMDRIWFLLRPARVFLLYTIYNVLPDLPGTVYTVHCTLYTVKRVRAPWQDQSRLYVEYCIIVAATCRDCVRRAFFSRVKNTFVVTISAVFVTSHDTRYSTSRRNTSDSTTPLQTRTKPCSTHPSLLTEAEGKHSNLNTPSYSKILDVTIS